MRQVLHSNAMFIDGVSVMVSLSVFNNQLPYHDNDIISALVLMILMAFSDNKND